MLLSVVGYRRSRGTPAGQWRRVPAAAPTNVPPEYTTRPPVTACHIVTSWHTIRVSQGAVMTMLDRMRRHMSWLKWSLGLVVLAFIIFYIPDLLGTRGGVGVDAAGETI